MPIVFSTPTSHRILMFDKDGTKMLKVMKTSGNIPGALYPEAIPDALEALQECIKLESADECTKDDQKLEDSNYVGIYTKAFPLVELMQRAIEQNEKLLWEKG